MRITTILLVLLFAVCAVNVLAAAETPKEAVAILQASSGSSCKGMVRFSEGPSGVRIVADIEGLTPGAKHGFHVHEFGDCSSPDATSAGSHYDAEGTKHHGSPTDMPRHSGDMGNLQADANGKAHLELLLQGISILGHNAPIAGRSVVVHAKPDDFGQPVGNAGARIGCGVIGVTKPVAK